MSATDITAKQEDAEPQGDYTVCFLKLLLFFWHYPELKALQRFCVKLKHKWCFIIITIFLITHIFFKI